MQIGEKKEISFIYNGEKITKNVEIESIIKQGDFLYHYLDINEESDDLDPEFELFTIYNSLGNEITHRAYCKKNAKFDDHGNLINVILGDQYRIFCEYKNDCNYSARKIPGIKQGFQQRQVLQLQRRLLHVFLLSRYKNGF